MARRQRQMCIRDSFNRLVNDVEMPELIWKLNEDYLEATIDYDGDYSVSLWVAENSDGRDFRLWMEGELWIQSPIKKSKDGNYRVEIKAEENKYKAVMLEFIVDPNSGFPLIISTILVKCLGSGLQYSKVL